MPASNMILDQTRAPCAPVPFDTCAMRDAPFAHVVREQFIESDLFGRLRDSFPTCPASSGPTGFSLYPADSAYDRLIRSNAAWATLFHAFHCQSFIDWAGSQFASQWQSEGCNIDIARARYVAYVEDRIDKERSTLRKIAHQPHELWVRMDIYQGKVGYSRTIHRDHARRLLTLLIYFSDHEQDGMKGGELLLHASPWKRWLQPAVIVTPAENLMVAFACTDRSYHSVAQITAAERPRNYIQVQISSSVDLWPRGQTSPA